MILAKECFCHSLSRCHSVMGCDSVTTVARVFFSIALKQVNITLFFNIKLLDIIII